MKQTMYVSEKELRSLIKEIISNWSEGNEYNLTKHIKDVLQEERGISEDVKAIVTQIVNTITSNKETIWKSPNYKTSVQYNDKEIRCYFNIFKCKTPKEKEELLRNDISATDSASLYRYEGLIIEVYSNIIFVSGKIDYSHLYDNLYHEISHIFQQECTKQEYPNSEIYAKASSDIHSTNTIDRTLAEIIYLSNPVEQDAYVNGMYGELMEKIKNGKLPIDKKELSAYRELIRLYKAYQGLTENKTNPEMLSKLSVYKAQYGWGYKKFKNRCETAIKEFERKIARTMDKAQKDAWKYRYFINDGQDWLFY